MKTGLLALVFYTLTHGWYPQHCCSDKDCYPVPCEEILEEKSGGYSFGKLFFRKSQVYLSQDRKCHACIGKYPSGAPNPYCIFIQANT